LPYSGIRAKPKIENKTILKLPEPTSAATSRWGRKGKKSLVGAYLNATNILLKTKGVAFPLISDVYSLPDRPSLSPDHGSGPKFKPIHTG
jgi:hypothetical protein